MELFRLLGTIAVDNTEANNALDETSERAQATSNETDLAFGKIGASVVKIAKGVATAGVALSGAVFDQPTIFNTRLGLQGVGEAGPEAIAPVDVLQVYIRDAVNTNDEGIRKTIIEQTALLINYLSRYMPKSVMLNSGALVGELVPAINEQLSDRLTHTMRGNTR